VYLAVSAAVMGLVAHRALVNNGAPFVNAFQTIFPHGAWAGKLVAALAATSGFWALIGWTLVTAEVSRASASDGLFLRPFAWTDRKGRHRGPNRLLTGSRTMCHSGRCGVRAGLRHRRKS
jgi:basic amino acid/polyamine antiporter, APA family